MGEGRKQAERRSTRSRRSSRLGLLPAEREDGRTAAYSEVQKAPQGRCLSRPQDAPARRQCRPIGADVPGSRPGHLGRIQVWYFAP